MTRWGKRDDSEASTGVRMISTCLPGGTIPSAGTAVRSSGEVNMTLNATAWRLLRL